MDLHRFAIDGRVIGADDVQLQDALARAYNRPRVRAACVFPAASKCTWRTTVST